MEMEGIGGLDIVITFLYPLIPFLHNINVLNRQEHKKKDAPRLFEMQRRNDDVICILI